MIVADPKQMSSVNGVAKISHPPLPRVLYAIAMDGSQKFGPLEEQIGILGQAFQAENSLFLPLFLDPAGPGGEGALAFAVAGKPTTSLNLWQFPWKPLGRLYKLTGQHHIPLDP